MANTNFNTSPEEWDTVELFDYCTENELIPDDAVFENWMHDRAELLALVVEHSTT